MVKQWISLSSGRSSGSSLSSPLKESPKSGPKALLYYYFGDKNVGTIAI